MHQAHTLFGEIEGDDAVGVVLNGVEDRCKLDLVPEMVVNLCLVPTIEPTL